MRIAVVGSGSIGMLVTFYLSKSGHEVILLTNRKQQEKSVNENSLNLLRNDQKYNSSKVYAHTIHKIENIEPIDLLIITVKAYQVDEVLAHLENRQVHVKAILFMQNGMSHVENISYLGFSEVAVAVIEHGAVRINDFTVHHTGIGQLKWSYIREGDQVIKDVFKTVSSVHFNISYSREWRQMLEDKLIVNACINPLTALFLLKNGELLNNTHYQQMMKRVFQEVSTVLEIKTEKQADYWGYVKDICLKTADNHSSMVMDIKHRRKTEIDSIIGYLIRRAEKKQTQVAILPFLLEGIRAKEAQMGVLENG
ncbi:2-dehydropantoate 2-reductase [Halalkalibacter akibai]|uniref:2-dehydropantoate 2-reductase n=1 Tax=Halalkalibacter akibai (strain ATCC 43226 / DSM 21942 / CIP 109018 / JCM 9157 / 1139) TaxID=1236973 RepID=W4QP06_HALA3|nr:2-dehydropantoate 2-reductase [Halalkalibacter akibai]GAE33845.1 2-dehydropantoate 2-reductase [Halalkalibacter akibai JCM 9157]